MTALAWHQALCHALTGRTLPLLGLQEQPDLDGLFALIDHQVAGGLAAIREHGRQCLDQGEVWPHPIPAELRAGLGAAQLQAVITQAVAELGLGPRDRSQRVAPLRAPDADEQRLMRDVPPHHGG